MKNDDNNLDEKKEIKSKKLGFFKKVWYGITKIEYYPQMVSSGLGKTLIYFLKLILILAIVMCIGIISEMYQEVQKLTGYIVNESPDFSYGNEKLTVENSPLYYEQESTAFGKIIIDTREISVEDINIYISDLESSADNFAVVLNDSIIIKNTMITSEITYKYSDILEGLQITEFDKQDVIQYIESYQIIIIYICVYIIMLIYAFILYTIITFSNVLFLTVIGLISAIGARIKLRYKALICMAIYSLTLSILLNTIYIGVNIFIDFEIEYFEVMYISVATIYLVASIFILKSEILKQQTEIAKYTEEQAKIKQLEKEMEDKLNEVKREKKKDNKKQKEKSNNKEESEDNNIGEEPRSSET